MATTVLARARGYEKSDTDREESIPTITRPAATTIRTSTIHIVTTYIFTTIRLRSSSSLSTEVDTIETTSLLTSIETLDANTASLTTTSLESASPTTSAPLPIDEHEHGLSSGAKIGLGVGVGLGVILIGLAIAFAFLAGKRFKKKPFPLGWKTEPAPQAEQKTSEGKVPDTPIWPTFKKEMEGKDGGKHLGVSELSATRAPVELPG